MEKTNYSSNNASYGLNKGAVPSIPKSNYSLSDILGAYQNPMQSYGAMGKGYGMTQNGYGASMDYFALGLGMGLGYATAMMQGAYGQFKDSQMDNPYTQMHSCPNCGFKMGDENNEYNKSIGTYCVQKGRTIDSIFQAQGAYKSAPKRRAA